MPIDDDMNNLLHEANELTQAYRSEIANLGSFASEFGAAALGHATGVAVATAFPCDTFEPEVNHRPAVQQWPVCTP